MGVGETRNRRVASLAYWVLHLLPAGLLFSALDPWPSGFYAALRLIVCIAAIGIAILIYRRDRAVGSWLVAFGLTAVVVNPVVPIAIPREIWIAYIAIAALFLAHLIATRTPDS
jgi:hypothetical protein